jgi:hypothetical protein
MRKKKEEIVEEEFVAEPEEVVAEPKILPLSVSFPSEDLNTLVAKVNEIIEIIK